MEWLVNAPELKKKKDHNCYEIAVIPDERHVLGCRAQMYTYTVYLLSFLTVDLYALFRVCVRVGIISIFTRL